VTLVRRPQARAATSMFSSAAPSAIRIAYRSRSSAGNARRGSATMRINAPSTSNRHGCEFQWLGASTAAPISACATPCSPSGSCAGRFQGCSGVRRRRDLGRERGIGPQCQVCPGAGHDDQKPATVDRHAQKAWSRRRERILFPRGPFHRRLKVVDPARASMADRQPPRRQRSGAPIPGRVESGVALTSRSLDRLCRRRTTMGRS
jgi:hypothetical protein